MTLDKKYFLKIFKESLSKQNLKYYGETREETYKYDLESYNAYIGEKSLFAIIKKPVAKIEWWKRDYYHILHVHEITSMGLNICVYESSHYEQLKTFAEDVRRITNKLFPFDIFLDNEQEGNLSLTEDNQDGAVSIDGLEGTLSETE